MILTGERTLQRDSDRRILSNVRRGDPQRGTRVSGIGIDE